MTFVVALLAKLTLILAAGLIVSAAMRGASPSLRHLVLLATLVCGLTLPAAMLIAPRWDVAILPGSAPKAFSSAITPTANRQTIDASVQPLDQPSSRASAIASPEVPITAASEAPSEPRSSAADIGDRSTLVLPGAWVLGFLIVLAWLVIGRVRLGRIASDAWPLATADWQKILDAARSEAGVTRSVKLLSSPVVSTPLTWGSLSPVILLPEDALEWSEDHRRVVLRHELAHVARRDSFTQLVAGFVCALYWFHPLAWMVERRLRAECERACDDRVVSLGTPAAEYASHLLEVARSARAFGAPGFLSVAMARPSQLEGRLLAVLNGSRQRIVMSPRARGIAVLLSALVFLPLAAFRPVPRETAAITVKADVKPARIKSTTGSDKYAKTPKSDQKVVNTYKNKVDTTFQLSASARAGGTLELDLRTGGSVNITSWDRPEVSVRASLGGRDWRETRVSIRPADGSVTLESSFVRSSGNQSTSHHFDIRVPRKYDVHLKSAGGSLSIANVSGEFTGSTGGGEITIRNANGDVSIRTGGGEINVSDSNLNGSVSTGGGMVRIMRVNGRLKGNSGSGPVIYSDSRDPKYDDGVTIGAGQTATIRASDGSVIATTSGSSISTSTSDKTTTTYVNPPDGKGYGYGYGTGAITMTSAGGALRVPSAPNGALVTTGGGKIYIGPSGGKVYARTGGGSIDIGPATGSVAAFTGAGDVNIELKGASSHDVDVTSGKGQVVLVVPDDLNATLELETAYTDNFRGKTRIISDWPLSVTETSTWDSSQGTPRKYIRARQSIGRGGGLIRVHTVNGNIILKRSGQ